MDFTIWGARGSIPVSGEVYLRYGGDTTCASIETKAGEIIILDAGTGIRRLGNRLLKEGRKDIHLLLTHAHWDHIMGFPFFKPLYRSGTTIRVHGCTFAQQSIRRFLKEIMQPPFFPVDLANVSANVVFDDECPLEIAMGGVSGRSILLNHPNQGFGFRLSEGDRSIAFFPDNELTHPHPGGKAMDEYARFLEGVDFLVHDAEYLPEEYERYSRGWGHSVHLDTVRFALKASAGHLLLWHINQERTDEQVDKMLADARKVVEEAGSPMTCDIARTGYKITI